MLHHHENQDENDDDDDNPVILSAKKLSFFSGSFVACDVTCGGIVLCCVCHGVWCRDGTVEILLAVAFNDDDENCMLYIIRFYHHPHSLILLSVSTRFLFRQHPPLHAAAFTILMCLCFYLFFFSSLLIQSNNVSTYITSAIITKTFLVTHVHSTSIYKASFSFPTCIFFLLLSL